MVVTRAQSKTEPLKIGPDSPFSLQVFDEGSAHIFYTLAYPLTGLRLGEEHFETSPPENKQQDQTKINLRFKGKLLRLRKAVPSAVPTEESHAFFKSRIEPLFP